MKNRKLITILIIICCFFMIITCGESEDTTDEKTTQKIFIEGVSDDEIILGMSAPFKTPPLSFLGEEMLKGAMSYIKEINENGGVHGRNIKIITYNDDYEAKKTFDNTNRLINKDRVLALFNYIGSMNTVKILPLLENYKFPLFGIASNDMTFRNFYPDYVYNVRPSVKQEIILSIKYFIEEMNIKKFAIFYQNDSFGESRIRMVEEVIKDYDVEIVSRASYEPNSMEIEQGINSTLEGNPELVLLFAFTGQIGKFVRTAKQTNPDLYFYCTSSGFETIDYVNAIIGNTEQARDKVFISQPFPSPWESNTEVLKKYHNLLLKHYPESLLNYYNMEGFVNAVVLVRALEVAGKDLTRESFFKALKSMTNESIFGIKISYDEEDNQGMSQVFLTKITNGIFETINDN